MCSDAGRTVMVRLMLLLFLAGSGTGCTSVKPRSGEAALPPLTVESLDAQMPLTVERAVDIALRRDPEILAARHAVSAAYWDKVQASLPGNPSLSFSADAAQWAVKLAGNISELIDLGGRRSQRVEMAQSREALAVQEVIRRRIEVARAVRLAFVETLARREAVVLLERKVESTEHQRALARQLVEWGEIAALDALEIDRVLAQARSDLADEATRQQRAEVQLGRYLGGARIATVELDPAYARAVPGTDADETPPQLVLSTRPEWVSVMLRMAEHEILLSLARIAWLPDVGGGPMVRHENDRMLLGGEISLTIPVFDRGRPGTAREQARLAALEEELLAVQAGILLEVHDAWLALRRAETYALRDAPELMDIAERARKLTAIMVERGETDRLQLLRAEGLGLDAALNLNRATLAWRQAEVALAAALGDQTQADYDEREHDGRY